MTDDPDILDPEGLLIDGRPIRSAKIADEADGTVLDYVDEHGVMRWLDLYLLNNKVLNPRISRVKP